MLMLIKLPYNFVDILVLVVKYIIHVHAFIEHINRADICKGALLLSTSNKSRHRSL